MYKQLIEHFGGDVFTWKSKSEKVIEFYAEIVLGIQRAQRKSELEAQAKAELRKW